MLQIQHFNQRGNASISVLNFWPNFGFCRKISHVPAETSQSENQAFLKSRNLPHFCIIIEHDGAEVRIACGPCQQLSRMTKASDTGVLACSQHYGAYRAAHKQEQRAEKLLELRLVLSSSPLKSDDESTTEVSKHTSVVRLTCSPLHV